MQLAAAEDVQVQILYWAGAFLIALVGGAWKAAGMRGNLSDTWADRVIVLKAGLTQGAIQELNHLRERIDELLVSEKYPPDFATADPAPLLQSVRKFQKLMKTVRKVSSHFKWLLRLGNVAVAALISMIIGVVLLALYRSNLAQVPFQSYIGGILLAVGLLVGTLCFIFYWAFQNSLSGAEILARASVSNE